MRDLERLSLHEGTALVRRARKTVESYLSAGKIREPVHEGARFLEKTGVFVTLLATSEDREMRGCMGAPFPDNPLIVQLDQVAIEAATMDPRFTPVDLTEFNSKIIVEVTVLTPPEVVKVQGPLEYKEMIHVGRDGIIVDGIGSRGLLLPQVAVEEGFDSEEFLCQCCLKAGLLPDAWLSGKLRVSRFQGQVFSEDRPGGSVSERYPIPMK